MVHPTNIISKGIHDLAFLFAILAQKQYDLPIVQVFGA